MLDLVELAEADETSMGFEFLLGDLTDRAVPLSTDDRQRLLDAAKLLRLDVVWRDALARNPDAP